MNITDSIKYVGVNDYGIRLFEGQYVTPNGMCYNSYVIDDEKLAVMDTVDKAFSEEWLTNLERTLNGREPDYLIVQHMEPDHSANIVNFTNRYKNATVVASAKAFAMMKNFFGEDFSERRNIVSDGEELSLGYHKLKFIFAPMVHWPEVMVTYDSTEKVLFSADAFGKFGTHDADEAWTEEARRYYIGIVGKYGAQVQSLLKKASALEINIICALHGPVLKENLANVIGLYDKWSKYEPEEVGTVIAYASVYGNTAEAALALADSLREGGCKNVVLHDLVRGDISAAVADSFRYTATVFASPTYNADVFPPMRQFITALVERNFRSRRVAFMENGSWAPMAAKVMKELLTPCRDISYAENTVKILSALNPESKMQINTLADELCKQ